MRILIRLFNYIILQRISHKEVQKRVDKISFYYFCLTMEGSGSVPLTNGSGPGGPKKSRILWILIRNTAGKWW